MVVAAQKRPKEDWMDAASLPSSDFDVQLRILIRSGGLDKDREREGGWLVVAQNDRNGPHFSLSPKADDALVGEVPLCWTARITQPSFHLRRRRIPPTAKMRCISSGSRRRRRRSGRWQRMAQTYEQHSTVCKPAGCETDWSAITKCLRVLKSD